MGSRHLRNGRILPASGFERMIFKIVTLFLVAMGVLAMFGKLQVPGVKSITDKRCPKGKRFRIGKGPCPCKTKG